jgi:hypothetical protein
MRSAEDDEQFARIGNELVDGIAAVLDGWLIGAVTRFRPELAEEAAAAAADGAPAVIAELRELVELDLDEQTTTPLTVLRRAVSIPTAVLSAAGVEPLRRDPFDVTAFPDDLYGLTPAAFNDVDGSLGGLGIRWGAAKAHVHLSRRRG